MEIYSNDGEETEYTYDHKKVLKIFFRWFKLGNREYKTCLKKFKMGDPPETEDIIMKKPSCRIAGTDLITDIERQWLLQACDNSRDRALIDVPLDGGIRPGELLTRHIRDVKQDKHGFLLYVEGKTGTRTVRLIHSTPSLVRWLSEHPFKENPNAPLWVNFEKSKYGQSLSYGAVRAMIKRVCEKVKEKHPDFQKRVFLNLFRHTEATNLAKFMPEQLTRKRHGWSPNSRMPSRYTHLLNADVEEALLRYNGIQLNEENKPRLPKKCEICDMINPEESIICSKCGRPLDIRTAIEMDAEKEVEIRKTRDSLEELKRNQKEEKQIFESRIVEIENKIKKEFEADRSVMIAIARLLKGLGVNMVKEEGSSYAEEKMAEGYEKAYSETRNLFK